MLYEEIMMPPANRPNIDPETPPNNPQRKTENISETDIKVIQKEFGKNAEYNGTFIWQYRNIFLTFYKTVEQKTITYNFILFGKQEENQENNDNEQFKTFDSVELERGGFHSLKSAIKNAQAKIEQIVDGTPFKKINDPVCPQCGSALPDPGEIYYDCPKCGKIHKYKIEKK